MVIRRDHVVAFVMRNAALEFSEGLRKNPTASILVEPAQLSLRAEKNSAQDQRAHALGVGFRIGKRQRRTPRAAKKLPAIDAELLANPLDVLNEILRRVVFDRCVGRGLTTAALIEQDDAIFIRIVKTAHCRIATAARTTVNNQNRLTVGIAALLDIERVTAANSQAMLPKGKYRRIKIEPVANCHVFAAFNFLLAQRSLSPAAPPRQAEDGAFFAKRWMARSELKTQRLNKQ